jgi:two-component system, NarL family, sensor histidine kinase DesK
MTPTARYRDGHGATTVAIVAASRDSSLDRRPAPETASAPEPTSAPEPRTALQQLEELNATPVTGWRRRRALWAITGIWLFYLWQPVMEAWHQPNPIVRVLGIAAIVLFAAIFIYSFARARAVRQIGADMPTVPAVALVSSAFAVTVAITAILGPNGLSLLVYVGVMAIFLLPYKWGPAVVLGLIVGSYATDRLWPGAPTDFSIQFSILIGAFAMFGVMQLIRRNAELAEARSEITRLVIAEERNRFARDLHDILGHSLTVVAVKAELAGRLVRLDPERAEHEIGDVERLSREALADVRSALSGYRQVTLMGELANARSALAAAGIEAELPQALDDVPADRRELFGWVLREAVTNVVRHSGASHCRVRVTDKEIRITDDGRGPVNGSPVDDSRPGVGLVGLRERVEAAGARLTVGQPSDGGFELRVWV